MRTKSKETSLNQGLRKVNGCPVSVAKDSEQLTEILERIEVKTTSFVVITGSLKRAKQEVFSGDLRLESVRIPEEVEEIEDLAFSECVNLKHIEIPNSVVSIGKDAFSGCSSLKTVTCEISTPISGYSIFAGTPINEATLYVPEASLASYKTTRPWKSFGTILPIESSGIESRTIGTVADVEAVYGLDGKRCDGTKSGMNIIRMSNGTTRKIVK